MNPWPVLIPVIAVAVVALMVVLGVVVARRERRRRTALRQWASRYGWTYQEKPRPEWAGRLPGRYRRGVELMLSGVLDGYPVSVAEYSYVTRSTSMNDGRTAGSTTTNRYHHLVVVAVRLPWAAAPVGVAPRHGVSRLGRAIFGERGASVGDEAFDRAYKVSTKDPDLARRLIGPALAAEHLAERVPAWSLNGADLLTYRPGRLPDPAGIPELAAPLVRVASLFGR